MAEAWDDILKGAREAATDPGRAAQPSPDATAAPVTTGEQTAAPQATEKPDDEDGVPPTPDMHGNVPLKALEAERSKRHDWKTKAIQAEERLRAAEEKLAANAKPAEAPPSRPVVQPPKAPNPIEDPEGFVRHQNHMMEQQRLNTSEMMLRQQHDDVDAKLAVFLAAAKDNPSLLQKANQQAHPWGWMYEQAGKLAATKAIADDPKAYEEQMRARIRAEIEAERGAPTIDAVNAKEANPHKPAPSLAAARSAAPAKVTAQTWSGPTPIGALLGANAVSVRGR